MAIKDLNNKKTGDKLYASEWNDVMNEILGHFANKRIHQDMIITSNNELVYTDENNVRHQYVLHTKSGITYGELTILLVNDTELNNNTYAQSDISSEGSDISFQISYRREVLEDGEHEEWQTSGARIVPDGDLPEGLELLTPDDTNSIKIRVSENQSYDSKNYNFDVKVSMAETLDKEDQDNTKVFRITLNQNSKAESWGAITINNITLDSGNDPNEIPSAGLTDVKITLDFKQVHNEVSESISSSDIQELIYTDYGGNSHTLTESNQITISIPKNQDYNSSDKKSRSITILSIKSHDYIQENLVITLLQDEVNEISRNYGNNKTITWSGYDNLDYTANSQVSPKTSTFSIPILIDYDNGDTDVPGTPITSGGLKSYSFTPRSGITGVNIIQNTGVISRNIANNNPSELLLGTAKLTITVDAIPGVNPVSVSKEVEVKQSELPMPDLIYGQIPITNSDELDIENSTKQLSEFVTNQLIDEFNNRFTTLPTSQFTSTFPTILNKDYTIYCYLIKNYGNKQIKYVPPVGQKQPITFIGMNAGQYSQEISNYLYNDTYKLILILGEVTEDNRTINTIIE